MKKFITMLLLVMAVFVSTNQYSYATAKQDNCNFVNIENTSTPQMISTFAPQDGVGAAITEVRQSQDLLNFLIENKIWLLGLLMWLGNRFLPTKWKDPLVRLITWLNSLIPDKKKYGGSHNGK